MLNKKIGDYVICKHCKDINFVCNVGGLLLPWDCDICKSKKTVIKKEDYNKYYGEY